jgi:hypothetical protein
VKEKGENGEKSENEKAKTTKTVNGQGIAQDSTHRSH